MRCRRRILAKRPASFVVAGLLLGCAGVAPHPAAQPQTARLGSTIPIRPGPCELVDASAIARTLGPPAAPPRAVQRTDGRACVFTANEDRTFILFFHRAGFLAEAARRFRADDVTVADGVVSVQGERTAAVLLDAGDIVIGVYGPSEAFAEVAELAELADVALDPSAEEGTTPSTHHIEKADVRVPAQ